MMRDPDGWTAVWEFATERWDELVASVPEQFHPYLAPGLGQSICDEQRRAEFEAFADKVETPREPRLMAQTRERIANCLDMKALHQRSLSAYLGPSAGGFE